VNSTTSFPRTQNTWPVVSLASGAQSANRELGHLVGAQWRPSCGRPAGRWLRLDRNAGGHPRPGEGGDYVRADVLGYAFQREAARQAHHTQLGGGVVGLANRERSNMASVKGMVEQARDAFGGLHAIMTRPASCATGMFTRASDWTR